MSVIHASERFTRTRTGIVIGSAYQAPPAPIGSHGEAIQTALLRSHVIASTIPLPSDIEDRATRRVRARHDAACAITHVGPSRKERAIDAVWWAIGAAAVCALFWLAIATPEVAPW